MPYFALAYYGMKLLGLKRGIEVLRSIAKEKYEIDFN